MHDVLCALDRLRQRATYGAVAGHLGRGNYRNVMQGHALSTLHSWVVSKKTRLPTGYAPSERHPRLESNREVFTTSPALTRAISATRR